MGQNQFDGIVCCLKANNVIQAICNQKMQTSFSHSRDIKGDPRVKKGAIWDYWGHSRSSAILTFDRAHRRPIYLS